MFNLSREEQQQAFTTKPVLSLKELARELDMDELVEPVLLVEINNAIQETFEDWAWKINDELKGEKVFAYNDMCIIQETSCTWSTLHNVITTSRDSKMKQLNNVCAALTQANKIHECVCCKLEGGC